MSRSTIVYVLSAACGLLACDRQVDREYQGEALLQIKGSVAIPLGLEQLELVPAIAFSAMSEGSHVYNYTSMLEVEVSGDFPSSFTLSVLDPPPSDAIETLFAGQPSFAIGHITAVPPGFPAAVTDQRIPNACGEACDVMLTCEGEDWRDHAAPPSANVDPLYQEIENPGACFHQLIDCSAVFATPPAPNCTPTETRGDASLAFAGFSQNVRILYLAEPAERDSHLSWLYGDGEALAAGYHAFTIPPEPMQTVELAPAEFDPCYEQAVELAIPRFNAAHGTNHTSRLSYGLSPDAEYYAFEQLVNAAFRELGCTRQGEHSQRIDPGSQPISIELGTFSPISGL